MNTKRMHNEDPSEKVALLFEECLEISDPAKRDDYLSSACSDDKELRQAVERLLDAHEASGKFLGGGTPPVWRKGQQSDTNSETGLELGESIGPYRLLGLIGEGSTSTVFLAEQEEPIRRWVALKIIKPGMDSRKVILRFGLERQALALMDHPGIAKLLDAGATPNGRPFFVMELVSGTSITDYCDDHQLTIPERLNLFKQVCNAVFHAHQRGIIHRDLKPDNILVSDADGRMILKIVDFGIAKVLHNWGLESATRTSALPFLGTPAYMSPEQVGMTSTALDTRTDIYSLGALLCELLTGHPPFDPKTLLETGLEEMCHIIRNKDPLAPSIRYSQLPEDEQIKIASTRGTSPNDLKRMLMGDLNWITLKTLEKQRDLRYETAFGLARDIDRHFEHLPVTAAAPSRRYKFRKLLRRKRKLMIGGSLVAVFLLISICMVIYMAVNARMSAKQARASELAANKAEQHSHNTMVAMHVASGLADAKENHPDTAVLWFAHAAELAGTNSHQSKVNSFRALNWLGQVPVPVEAFMISSASQKLEFSQDSRFILIIEQNHNWHLWDSETREFVPWTGKTGKISSAAWSTQGSNLALALLSGNIQIYEASTGSLLETINTSNPVATLGFTADSNHLIFGNSSLQVYDLEEKRWIGESSNFTEPIVGISISQKEMQVAAVLNDGHVNLFNIDHERGIGLDNPFSFPHKQIIRTEGCPNKSDYQEDYLNTPRVSLPLLAGGDTRLVTRSGAYEVTLWDLPNKRPTTIIDTACCSCKFITSPEKGLMACSLQGGKVGMWDIATGQPQQVLPSQGSCILDIDFGMAGQRLITAETNGTARVWSVETGKEIQSPLHHSTDVDHVALSNDGHLVATVQSDGLVRIWQMNRLPPEELYGPMDELPTTICMDSKGSRFILIRDAAWDPSPEVCLRQITVYSAASGEPEGITLQLDGCVSAADFSPDSTMLAVGVACIGNEDDTRIEFIDLENQKVTERKIPLPSNPASVAWNPKRDEVSVVCDSGELIFMNLSNDKVITWKSPVPDKKSNIHPMVKYTPDGQKLVYLGPNGFIEVRDADTGKLCYPPLQSPPDGIWSFDISPDSQHMATSTIHGQSIVWNLLEGIPVGQPLPHPSWIYRGRFNQSGDTLVTASHDGNVRLWNWRTGLMTSEALTHPEEVYDAVQTPDERWVITACRDGSVRVWDPLSGQIIAPPIKVGRQAFNIEFTRNGEHAIVGSLGNNVPILSLGLLQKKLSYEPTDLCLIGEVLSGYAVQAGALHKLTTREWMSRYQKINELHPEVLQSGQTFAMDKLSLSKTPILLGTQASVGTPNWE